MQYIDSGLLVLALFDHLHTCYVRRKGKVITSAYAHTGVWCALAFVAHVVLG